VSAKDDLAKVERERANVNDARLALEERLGRVHPLVLTGGALVAGLVVGRLIGRPRLSSLFAPSRVLGGVVQQPLVGLIASLIGALVVPASADSKTADPPGTPPRAP
jgi:hypothetical protein